MRIGKWDINENDEAFQKRLLKAQSSALTPLGIRKDVGFAVFSGRHGVYNTTLESCNCFDFEETHPCKHILRLAMEMGFLQAKFETNISDVKFPQEPTTVTKKIFIDAETGEVFDKRPLPEGSLTGKTFVITGTFPDHTRDDLTALINKAGGNVSSSVSKMTSFLVFGEAPGSKLTRAQQLGVPTITCQQLLELIEKG